MPTRLNYDPIAASYNRRYTQNRLEGVAAALQTLVQQHPGGRVLEAGCGTGHWLTELSTSPEHLVGLDYSHGMLSQAQKRQAGLSLVRGNALHLPYQPGSFGVVYCVNALHHFEQPQAFISEAWRVLQAGGSLAIIGQVPQSRVNRWYVYEYFEGTYALDLARFPTWGQVLDWALAAGFSAAAWQPVEWINDTKRGTAVLADPFLKKDAVSQLALLSQAEYEAGLHKIETDLAKAQRRGAEIDFICELRLDMLLVRKGDHTQESK